MVDTDDFIETSGRGGKGEDVLSVHSQMGRKKANVIKRKVVFAREKKSANRATGLRPARNDAFSRV